MKLSKCIKPDILESGKKKVIVCCEILHFPFIISFCFVSQVGLVGNY